MSIDIETHDPNLLKKGPGEIRRDGYILGVGIQEKGKRAQYLDPIMDRERIENMLSDPCPKVAHNAAYDIPWLEASGFPVAGKVHDTMIIAALLDEHSPSFSLDSCAHKYLGEAKGDDEIRQYAESKGWKGPPQSHLAKMPRSLVGRYCKMDVDQTLRILDATLPLIEEQNLREIYEIEIGLFPLMRLMRRSGIAVDLGALSALKSDLQLVRAQQLADLIENYGEFNIRSGKQIAGVLDASGIGYGLTAKGNPKLGKAELARIPGIGEAILSVREISTLLDNFVDGAFPEFMVEGRLHPQFLQTKRDEGGTVSGRFSARHPNLQQAPARHPVYGSKIRGLFIPDEGRVLLALDYDGIESRLFAHFAVHGEAIRRAYNEDPELDYHQAVADMAGIERPPAKTINFAALYGAGVKKIAEQLGRGQAEGAAILAQYHSKFPAVKATMRAVEMEVRRKGYIETIGGRRARITPAMRVKGQYYLFLNRLIQGSAADLLKKAMYEAWKAGVFETITPQLLVHDEVVGSVEKGKEGDQAVDELKHIMETAYEFSVPIRVSGGRGKNWAEAH